MKKLKLYLIALLLAAFSQQAAAITAGETFTQDGFTYAVISTTDNTVQVKGTSLSGDITIPSNVTYDAVVWTVTSIGVTSEASSWTGVTGVTIPETVTTISTYAFRGASLTELHIPASVTSIAKANMRPGSSLQRITVDAGNDYFEADADGVLYTKGRGSIVFMPYSAPVATDYVIDSNVTKLDYENSVYNINITSLTLPAGLTELKMSRNATIYSPVLEEFKVAAGNTSFSADADGVLYDYSGTTLVAYPYGRSATDYQVNSNVTNIGSYAFRNNSQLVSLDINQASLSASSIFNNSKLTTITLGATVTENEISGGVSLNSKLANYIIDSANPYLSTIDGVIYSADKQTLVLYPTQRTGNYTFPDEVSNLKTIADKAFYGAKLSGIMIPSTVETIGVSAFYDCTNLTSVTFANVSFLKTISSTAFYKCRFETLELPASVEVIDQSAFKHCYRLTSITIPEGSQLQDIGEEAFRSCSSLTTVTVADGSQLQSIGTSAFVDCSSLTSFNFEGSSTLKTIGQTAFVGTALESFQIPASVTTIGKRAFGGVTTLTDISFADDAVITSIGNAAFADCGIEDITLPSSVKTIGEEAFRNCTALTTVELGAQANNVHPRAFKGCTNLTEINVADANTKYSSVQGFLCNKAKTTLLLFPPGAAREDFTLLPPSLTTIGANAFYDVEGLTNICIPRNIAAIESRAFGLDNNLNSVAMLGDVLIDPANIGQNTTENQNLNAFDDGTVEGTENMFDNITLYLTRAAYTDWTDNHKDTGDAYDTFYSKFKDIKTTFTVANATCGGTDEFLPVSANSANLLSTTSTKETYVVPTQVNNTEDGMYYNVNLIGDYAFENAPANIKEVVMNSKVGYIGAKAFDNGNIERVIFTNATPADYLSTEYFGMANTYNEFAAGQKIYVRADALSAYQSEWSKYSSQISCDIPLKSFAANGSMPFSREFDVELVASDGESTPVLAYIPDSDAGLGRNRDGDLIEYILMKQLSATVGGTKYTGTYVPAGTAVMLRAANATADATYRIGTKGSSNPVTSDLTGALYEDATTTVPADAYGYYTLDGDGNGTRATGNVTIEHNTAFLDASDMIQAGVPCTKATLLYEAPSTEQTTLEMTDESTDATVTLTVSYDGPITLGSGLTYTDYNDIPTPGTAMSFTRDHTSSSVTLTGNVTALSCNSQKVGEITTLPSSLESLSCTACGLTALDVSGCPALTTINCANNHLAQLDLSENDALTGGTISPQGVSGYVAVENEKICMKNDVNGQTSVICDAVNDYEYAGGEQTLEVATGAQLASLQTMIVNANAGRAHVEKVGSKGVASLFLDYAAEIPDGVEAFYCGGIDGDLTYLYNLTGAIQANQGFMVRADAGWYVWNAATSTPQDISAKNIFRGSTTGSTCTKRSVLTLGTGAKTGRMGFNYYNGTSLAAYRIYIPVSEMDSYARQHDFFQLAFDEDMTTGLRSVADGQPAFDKDAPAYNLAGQRVGNGYQGIVIQNGKRFVIK